MSRYNNQLHTVTPNEDYLKELSRHKTKKKIIITLCIAATLLIIAGGFLWSYFHCYKGYKVIEKKDHSDSTFVQYETLNDLLIRYTRDGISLFENNDNLIWSATFEMQSPKVEINGDFTVSYEKNGKNLYFFDTKKQLYTYQSTLPIKNVCVSEKGTVALIVEEDDQIHRIQYLDKSGELIAEGRVFFKKNGYPMDMSLSADGLKLCISYYYIEGAAEKTKLVFYSFDKIGSSKVDNIVTEDEYSEEIIPTVKYISDDTLVAVGNTGIYFYSGKIKPTFQRKIDINEKIKSVVFDKKTIGIFLSEGENYGYRLKTYNLKGKKIADVKFKFNYNNVYMKNGKILLYNASEWKIYMKNGILKSTGKYNKSIVSMVPDGINQYIIVGSNRIERIKLSR